MVGSSGPRRMYIKFACFCRKGYLHAFPNSLQGTAGLVEVPSRYLLLDHGMRLSMKKQLAYLAYLAELRISKTNNNIINIHH